jgi:electron transfer flavoprotein alpha subunit
MAQEYSFCRSGRRRAGRDCQEMLGWDAPGPCANHRAAVLGDGVQGAAQEAIYHGADTVYAAEAPVAQYRPASYTTAMAKLLSVPRQTSCSLA